MNVGAVYDVVLCVVVESRVGGLGWVDDDIHLTIRPYHAVHSVSTINKIYCRAQ